MFPEDSTISRRILVPAALLLAAALGVAYRWLPGPVESGKAVPSRREVATAPSPERAATPRAELPRPLTGADLAFLRELRRVLAKEPGASLDGAELHDSWERTSLRRGCHGFALALYQAGVRRYKCVATKRTPWGDVRRAIEVALADPRVGEFAAGDPERCRIQVDVILDSPEPVLWTALSATTLGPNRFEMGVDGLLVQVGEKRHWFLPGDAFVKSILDFRQLASHLAAQFGKPMEKSWIFRRFRTSSYVSLGDDWLPLFRGYPLVPAVTRSALERAAAAAVRHVAENQLSDGRFFYYYDAAKDSRRDHQHPTRDPARDPYYNMIRHNCGGVLLLQAHGLWGDRDLLPLVRRSIDFLLRQLVTYELPDGREAAYVYYNRKAKLGAAGTALYLLVQYARASGDESVLPAAKLLERHILAQLLPSGEFLYYKLYLDHSVSPEENRTRFSFYYPGQALLGLAAYLSHLADAEERSLLAEKIRAALRFLVVERPRLYPQWFTSLPSDAWLMWAIEILWDHPELRDPSYEEFVYRDADQMIDQMYEEGDGLYPDYAGAFYYRYGDFPYADGARAEGLLAAYGLATKTGRTQRAARYREALETVAWATLHLANTRESVYSLPRPELALGAFRFKYTRQWVRVDTTQHVAAFYIKFLPCWEE
ncbi:MAG: hypothetical protein HY720_24985 [Planctomycetes bacterium]|nr:hypothetical protein [Planctomycetota bacterium]